MIWESFRARFFIDFDHQLSSLGGSFWLSGSTGSFMRDAGSFMWAVEDANSGICPPRGAPIGRPFGFQLQPKSIQNDKTLDLEN